MLYKEKISIPGEKINHFNTVPKLTWRNMIWNGHIRTKNLTGLGRFRNQILNLFQLKDDATFTERK